MNRLLEFIDNTANSTLEFFSSSNLQMFLLVGTGLLTVGLLILALTRWGHSRPLWKCVVLSVTAHILLLGYAYGTRLILVKPSAEKADTVAAAEESKMNVKLVGEDGVKKEIAQRVESEKMSWNEFGNEQPMPEIEPLQRPEFDTEILIKRETPAFAEIEKNTPDRFAPMPKATLLPQAVPAPPIKLPVKIANLPEPELFKPEPNASPSTLRILPRKEEVEIAESSQTFVDALFAREGESNPAPERNVLEFARVKPNMLQPMPVQPTKGTFGAITEKQRAFVTTNHSTVRAGDGKPLPKMYELRNNGNRLAVLQARGGSIETEQSVEAALLWLANHQETDGRWNSSKHGGGTETHVFGHDRDGAGANADTGISGLALLSFLAGGHSHLEGPWRETVRDGLGFMISQQDSSGSFAGDSRLFARMYCHSMGLLAVSEAFAMTGDPKLRDAVQRGVNYSTEAQNHYDGGWRYQSGDEGDMSQFGWQALALHSAEIGGIEIPQDTIARMHSFIDSCAVRTGGGVAAYRPGHAPSTTMTAESLVARYVLGQSVSDRVIREAKFEISGDMPSADKPNLYYWYYGTMAMYFAGGPEWEQWNKKMKSALLSSQEHTGGNRGSWEPNGLWAGYGGRVYSTALSALMLEVYYRYLPTTQQPNERFAAQSELSR